MEPQLLVQHAAIAELCRRHGVVRLEAFGSAVDGSFDPQRSDYDFIAKFADDAHASLARRFIGFSESLESLLGRTVDLMTDHAIENPYLRAAVNASRVTLYEQPSSEALV